MNEKAVSIIGWTASGMVIIMFT